MSYKNARNCATRHIKAFRLLSGGRSAIICHRLGLMSTLRKGTEMNLVKKLVCLLAVVVATVTTFGGILSEWYADHSNTVGLEAVYVGDEEVKIKIMWQSLGWTRFPYVYA